MDVAAMAMSKQMQSLQSALSVSILDKAMNRDASSAALLLNDLQAANPAPAVLAPKAGGMDISV